MRQVGGSSSDNDGDKRALRGRENAARKRDDNDGRLLLGPTLLQSGLPAGLLTSNIQTRVDVRTARGLADHAIIMATIRLIKMNSCETRAAVDPFSRARVMIMMMMIKNCAGGENRQALIRDRDGNRAAFWARGGGGSRPVGGFMGHTRNMMMMIVMLHKARGGRVTRRRASDFVAGATHTESALTAFAVRRSAPFAHIAFAGGKSGSNSNPSGP